MPGARTRELAQATVRQGACRGRVAWSGPGLPGVVVRDSVFTPGHHRWSRQVSTSLPGCGSRKCTREMSVVAARRGARCSGRPSQLRAEATDPEAACTTTHQGGGSESRSTFSKSLRVKEKDSGIVSSCSSCCGSQRRTRALSRVLRVEAEDPVVIRIRCRSRCSDSGIVPTCCESRRRSRASPRVVVEGVASSDSRATPGRSQGSREDSRVAPLSGDLGHDPGSTVDVGHGLDCRHGST
ncbi:hypothetical protein PR202_ga19284 [Eleusine coracana subsp. coracana]|uniref:Uncharacterized protein n=1 Tax=Eleusine coracana subsp. coracana TaxID=191504 RepID=A0AAV5CTV8_ELECO|nr:hypothetical protein PR202_ga19284 [Eleusine coracana subsp. coracana]